ncbi:uridine kinase family protein [Rugosimonospora africana]|uniref:Phosphoribulokinase/uridine kinase domain-containing protein n=1 Tax=Rugosimonospora africana TaxID=556532 RepID=A0A8J3R2T5_9ACTN|nr:hypothetical protein [Rugosimonospora africana]GIH20315.1 hypothetical protein Raf01_84870 [Rugosimonospora africana]
MRVERFDNLAVAVLRAPARLGAVRVVAVDGPTGAGKTTFAERLAGALSAAGATVSVVHTDDLLDGWGDQFTFWPRLAEGVLDPLREGRPGRHPVYDWGQGRFDATREVPVADVLIVEGTTTTRPEARGQLSLSVFVSAPADLRLNRVVARDGAAVREPLLRWMDAEAEYFVAHPSHDWVDVLIDGASELGHDPSNEFVRLPRPGDDDD